MTALTERAPRVQRNVTRRIIVSGTLQLTAAAHFGSGDSEGATDMELLRDSVDDRALLTGSSIGGALRNYLHRYQYGYATAEQRPKQNDGEEPAAEKRNKKDLWATKGLAELLFGGQKGDEDGFQSPLMIADALSSTSPKVELRDGVRISVAQRTAEHGGKYDFELIAAGTTFALSFELVLGETPQGSGLCTADYHAMLVNGLTIALRGLQSGQISIGMKKRRGFGSCRVAEWKVKDYDLCQSDQLLAWMAAEDEELQNTYSVPQLNLNQLHQRYVTATTPTATLQPAGGRFRVEATFGLRGSLLIRAGQAETVGPDVSHLQVIRADGNKAPIISGTTLAGVLRHQVIRIANTLAPGSGERFAARMFGWVGREDTGHASRLLVYESTVTAARTDLVQNRVSIDRFTGGAYDGALFSEQPLFATDDARVALCFELEQPTEGEQGMLLLLLKDLWTGVLTIGGEASIGRGRLYGISAVVTNGNESICRLSTTAEHRMRIDSGDRQAMNKWVGTVLPEALNAAIAQSAREAVSDSSR